MKALTVFRFAFGLNGLGAVPRGLAVCLLCGLVELVPPSARAQVQRNWVAFYHNSTTMTNRPVGLVMDSQRNVYVAGYSQGSSSPGSLYTALKYDPDGQQLWVARHLESDNSDDKPACMVADAQGNLYLTGSSSNAVSGADFLTVKFDANGNELWSARYNGTANGDDQAKAMAVDAQGNLYVTGRGFIDSSNWPSGTVLDYAYTTIKYDAGGHQIWVSRYANGHTDANPSGSSNQDAQSVAIDAAGNIYVAGISVFFPDPRNPGAGFALVKYAPDGTQLGVWRYNFQGNTDGSGGRVSVALGPAGEVYVAGTMPVTFGPPPSFMLLKAASDGTWEWGTNYFGPNPYGQGGTCFQSLAVDAGANVLLVGTSPGASSYPDCATVKFDAQGNRLWDDHYNPGTNAVTLAGDLKLDSNGNAFVAGCCQSPDSTWQYLVVKYSPTGQRLWGALYGTGVAGQSAARAVAMDDLGHSVVTGYVPAPPALGMGEIYATVAYSAPLGAIVLAANGNAEVSFPGVPGSTGHFQASFNLVNWQDLGTSVVDTNGACLWTEAASQQYPTRFYRCFWP